MKVNFWQALGVVLIVVGVIFVIVRKTGQDGDDTAPADGSAPVATQPAT